MNKGFNTQKSLRPFFFLLLASLFAISGLKAQASFTGNNFSIPFTGTSGVAQGTVQVGCVGTIANGANITLNVQLGHTFMGDLALWLVGPGGQVLELCTRNGGGNNNMNVLFSDAAATNIAAATATTSTGAAACPPTTFAYNGSFKPEGRVNVIPAFPTSPANTAALSTFTFANTFSGINADGVWTLVINDHVGGDAGLTCVWTLNFAGVPVPPTCTFTGIVSPLNLSTAQNNCLSVPIPVPAVTGVQGACTGAVISYSLDNGPFVVVPSGNTTIPPVASGAHSIVWRVVNNCYQTSQSVQVVNVSDQVPPVLDCPADIIVNLDPGDCSAIVGYTVGVTDNCPFQGPSVTLNTITSGGNGNSSGGMVWFDLVNNTGSDLTVNGFGMNISNATMVNVYRKSGTFAGFQTNSGAWTLVGAANATVGPFSGPFPGNGTITPAPITFTIPPGTTGIALHTLSASSNYTNGNGPNQTYTDGTMTINCGSTANTPWGAPFTPRVFNGYVSYFTQSATADATQTAGIPSGGFFPIGTTQNCFQASDVAGNIGTCCFNVIVNEYPTPTTTLACNDNVQVSVNENCVAYVSTDMILEGGPYGCYDDYIVSIEGYGSGPGGVTIDNSAVGETLQVTVTDPTTGNSCWGTISVEDKIPPTIECRDWTIMCGAQLPDQPAPELTGYQEQIITGLNDLLEFNEWEYTFDYSYLPSTPVLDLDVRIQIDDHTWLPDIDMEVEAPDGTIVHFFDVGGCTGQEWPINCRFDDDGTAITQCVDLNGDENTHIQPLINGGFAMPVLFNANGHEASGIWKVRISDDFNADDGHIREVGLYIYVNLPQVDPADNCGDVDVTYTDTESGDPCEGLVVTRHWVATDNSGNTAACDQNITVQPLVLDSVVCPPAYVGHCGESSDPDYTGWPTVNGSPITDEDNVCNIFVGYWDKPLNDCGNGEKIVRTWTVLDWCTQTTVECVQVIKLSDDQAPELTCPADFEVGTDFWYCYANVSVPKPTVYDACGSAYTLSLTASAGHVVNYGNNYVINQLPLGDHTVTWHVTDECGNHSSCSFTISVVDDVVPVANCDEHTIVALTNDGPYGITLVPAYVFDDGSYDNCGPVTFRVRRMDSCIDFDWTTEGACVDDIPGGIPPVNSRDRGTVHRPCVPFACCDVAAGPIMVELEVTDAAGNRNYCMVEAQVQDKISPFVECPPDIVVSCDFWFNVQEGTFVDADGNANGNLDEDPLSHVFGNMYDAFQYNDDESVRQDIIINDPANEDYSQPHFWGIDGWADDNCEVNLQVRVRVIDDCSGDDLPGNAPSGAVKLIERRFSASDGNEGIAPGTCTQRIWVVDYDPFYITDNTCNNSNSQDGVIWPCDVLLTTCPEDLGNTGEPTIFDDACSLIGVTYKDTRFDFVDGACFKILREWSVIDWCQYRYDGEGGYYGLWHYTQVIKVHDEDGPEFVDACETQVLCVADDGVSLPDNNQAFLGEDNPLASSCSVHLNLSRTVHETCSDIVNYDVKIYPFNGSDFIYLKTTSTATVDENNDAVLTFNTRQNSIKAIRDNGLPYNSVSCGDYHRILWSVEDGCGNWSHCEYLIRLEDCKQPSPVCINGLSTVVMPIGGMVTVWAKDFNASSFDDCTADEDLLYSFSGDTYQPSYTYTCDNVPAFGVELSTQIWVADGGTDDNCNGQISWNERNKDYCTTTIVITDNAGVCNEGDGSILAGDVLTEDIQSVEQTAVSINAPGHVFPTYVTTQNGQYHFDHLILPSQFSVHAERNDAHRNGVSTLDLVKIQKHLLGIELMNSPYDLIAADANNSQNVSAIDLVELRKLILGIYTELPANKSWRFVDKSFQFADETNPWPFSESISMDGIYGNEMDKDFVAIKVGDVNNTVKANAAQVLPRNGNGVVNLIADNRTVNAGEMVDVAIRSTDFVGIEGYQFTLQANGLEFRGVESGLLTMTDENMGVFGNTLTTSWYKIGGVSATSSDVLFTLHFQATVAGQLSEMISLNSRVTEAEAYNTSADIKDLKLNFRGTEVGAEFALYQNEPNPFKGNTTIGYDLPAAGKATLSIFDVTGKVLVVKEQESVKGYNTISVSSKDIPSVGVLYYRLDASEYTATKKMIIIE